jgi:hypothetical protein
MSDDADRAQLEIDASLNFARSAGKAAPKLRPTGRCYNCEETLERAAQLFCDVECEKDFEKRRRANRASGTPTASE